MDIIRLSDFKRIYQVTAYQKELTKVLNGFGDSDFISWYLTQLRLLDDTEINFISEFERRFEYFGDGLYGITYRHKKKNIRILFTISKAKQIVILLCPFDEKNKSDYKKNFEKAKKRIKEIREYLL